VRSKLRLAGATQARKALQCVALVRSGRDWEAVFLLLGGLRGARAPSAALEIAFGLEPRLDCWRSVVGSMLAHCEREGTSGLGCASDCIAGLRMARQELALRLPAADFRLLVPAGTTVRPPVNFMPGLRRARQRANERAGVLALSGLEGALARRQVALWNSLNVAADQLSGADRRDSIGSSIE